MFYFKLSDADIGLYPLKREFFLILSILSNLFKDNLNPRINDDLKN